MAVFSLIAGVCRGLVRGAVRALLWAGDRLAHLFRRRPAYNTLLLDITAPPAEEPTTALRALLHSQPPDLLTLTSLLRWAREDERILAVVVTVSQLDMGWARVQSLRRSLLELRQAGKQVWVYLAEGGMREYYLASAANTLVMAPAGHLTVLGLATETLFFKGALDKLGVEAQVSQAGRYKAAGEPFTRESMSPAHREMMDGLLDDLYNQIVEGIARGRNKDKTAVRDLIDQGLFLAAEAQASGLIDQVGYADELPKLLEPLIGEVKPIEAGAYQRRRVGVIRRQLWRGEVQTIALMTVEGLIKHGETTERAGGGRAVGSTDFIRDLKHLAARPNIAALVLRIASPGGSGLASDLMWHELLRVREHMPVIVSMGDVAASGGYYLALAGDQVFAEEGSITGSIGVIAGKPVLQNLYTHLGIGKDILTRGRRAALFSDYLAFTPAEQERLDLEVQAFYRDFLHKVADCRGLSVAAVEPLAQGRVWSGRQAWARSLVDTLGGLEEAIAAAKQHIGVAPARPVRLVRFPHPSSLWRVPGLLRLLPRLRLGPGGLAGPIGGTQPWWGRERIWAILPVSLRFL